MQSTETPGQGRAASFAMAALFWFTPLWALLAALVPTLPPNFPLIVPKPLVLGFGAVALIDFGCVAVLGLRTRQPNSVRLAFLAGGVGAILAGACGFDPVTGIGFGVGVLGVGLGGLAISAARPATTRLCLRAFLWSSLCASLVALAMLATHRPIALYEYDNARAVGTFLNPNELAAYTIVALGGALPLAVYARDRLAMATCVVLAIALVATFSRWGMVSAACAVAAYALATGARRLTIAVLAIALLGVAVNAVLGARHHNAVDLEMRDAAWSVGIVTVERFPLLGVGPLAFARTYGALRTPGAPGADRPIAYDPHSVPLSIAAGGGLFGLAVLLAYTTWLQMRVYRTARKAPRLARLVALGLASGLIGLYIDCLPNTIVLFFPLGYQAVALALAVARNGTVT